MSTVAIGLIAFFAILSISQAAPSAVIPSSTDEEPSTALEPIVSLQQAPCIDINFGVGQVYICPTAEGCDQVYVLVDIPFVVSVVVDVVVCRSPNGGLCYRQVGPDPCSRVTNPLVSVPVTIAAPVGTFDITVQVQIAPVAVCVRVHLPRC